MNDLAKKRFARYYMLHNGNANEAWREAFPELSQDHQAVAVNASQAAHDPEVLGYIERIQAEDDERHAGMRDRVIQALERMAFTPVPEMVQLKGGIITHKDWDTLTEQQKWCIESAKQREDGCLEVKFHNRIKCLELLGKHVGMFSDQKPEQSAPVVWNINLGEGEK